MFEQSIADRMNLLGTESAFSIMTLANHMETKGHSVIHCEIGQPDFKTPRHIIDAAYKAMCDGYTGYSPTPGYPQVREVIAEYAARHKSIKTNRDEIVIVPGGKPVIFYTMLMLLCPGDEAIYPNPGFPVYESCIRFTGATPVPMPLLDENGFRPDFGQLRNSISKKTKLIVLNSPSNPTGCVFTADDIETLSAILREHPDVFILSDEIYDRLIYDGKAFSIASIPEFKDRTIILDGFSKAYAMTGWRIGYGIMNCDLAKQMELLMVNSNSCTASFTQMAAMSALQGSQDNVDEMRNLFKERVYWVSEALNCIPGITCQKPVGAFYAFPNISAFGLASKEFCYRLLEDTGVATAWGSSFGKYGEGHFRLSCANSLDNLKAAVNRIEKFVKTL